MKFSAFVFGASFAVINLAAASAERYAVHEGGAENAVPTSTLLTKYGRQCHRKSKSLVESEGGYPTGGWNGYDEKSTGDAISHGYYGKSTSYGLPVPSSKKAYPGFASTSSIKYPVPHPSRSAYPGNGSPSSLSKYEVPQSLSSAYPSSHVQYGASSVVYGSSSYVGPSSIDASSRTESTLSSEYSSSAGHPTSSSGILSVTSSVEEPSSSVISISSSVYPSSAEASSSSLVSSSFSSSVHASTTSVTSSITSSAAPSATICNVIRDGSFEDGTSDSGIWALSGSAQYDSDNSTPNGRSSMALHGSFDAGATSNVMQMINIGAPGTGSILSYSYTFSLAPIRGGCRMLVMLGSSVVDRIEPDAENEGDAGLWTTETVRLGEVVGETSISFTVDCNGSARNSDGVTFLLDGVTLSTSTTAESCASSEPGSGSSSSAISSLATSSSSAVASSSSVGLSSATSSITSSASPSATPTCDVIRDGSFENFVAGSSTNNWIIGGYGGVQTAATPYGNKRASLFAEWPGVTSSITQTLEITTSGSGYSLSYAWMLRFSISVDGCSLRVLNGLEEVDTVALGAATATNVWLTRTVELGPLVNGDQLSFVADCFNVGGSWSTEVAVDAVSLTSASCSNNGPGASISSSAVSSMAVTSSAVSSSTLSIASSTSSVAPPNPTHTCSVVRDGGFEAVTWPNVENPNDWFLLTGASAQANDANTGRVTPYGSSFLTLRTTSSTPTPLALQDLRFIGGSDWQGFFDGATFTYAYARARGTSPNMSCSLVVALAGWELDRIPVTASTQAEGQWLTRSLEVPAVLIRQLTDRQPLGIEMSCNTVPTASDVYQVWVDNVDLVGYTLAQCPVVL